MQNPKWPIGPGEYDNYIIKAAIAYNVANGLPQKVAGLPAGMASVRGCLHHAIFVDASGNAYWIGQNAYGVTGSSLSANLPAPLLIAANVLQAEAFCNGVGGNGALVLKKDGTVWIIGATTTAMAGDGTAGNVSNMTLVQVAGLSGITKIAAGVACFALNGTTGQLYGWGADAASQYWKTYVLARGVDNPDATRPGLVKLSGVTDICAGGFFNYAIAGGKLYGFGYYPDYYGKTAAASDMTNTPIDLTNVLKLPGVPVKMAMNTNATAAIMTDGSLWCWGDNAQGGCGNGIELNYATYKAPYASDWSRMQLWQPPVQIGIGLSFVNVTSTVGDAFYFYAEDVDGNLYFWGRDKGGVSGLGVVGTSQDQSVLPNSWDRPLITPTNPFALTAVINTVTRYPLPSTLPPQAQALAGADQAIVPGAAQLAGSSTGGAVIAWLWIQTAGPAGATIILPTSQTPKVTGLVPGTYTFQLQVMDNGWRTSTDTVTITVAAVVVAPPPPPVIILPPPVKLTVTGLSLMIGGVLTPVSLVGSKITYSDGSTQ